MRPKHVGAVCNDSINTVQLVSVGLYKVISHLKMRSRWSFLAGVCMITQATATAQQRRQFTFGGEFEICVQIKLLAMSFPLPSG